MRESTFLRQNVDSWKKFESEIKEGNATDPDLLAEGFIRVTDDLSYARTHYPIGNTVSYLNGLATRVHQLIYRNRKEKASRFITFFTEEIPLTAYELRKQILYSAIIFLTAMLIGLVSMLEAGDPQNSEFAKLILGKDYVYMTQQNIKNKDPLAVYNSEPEFLTFTYIVINNLRVDIITFIAGILTSFFAGYILFKNGVMVAAFMYMFSTIDDVERAIAGIMIHGTLELSAIVLSGAAGLALGNALLFPGTYKRMQSIKMGAKKGLKLLVGVLPVTIVAALLEGYATRHYKMPIWIVYIIIFVSIVFIAWYFVIYPKILATQIIREHGGSTGIKEEEGF